MNSRNFTEEPRFPEVKREQMTDAQKRVYDEIAGSRGSVRGPFGPLLRSPELADRWQRLGEYVRYKTSLPARLNEFDLREAEEFDPKLPTLTPTDRGGLDRDGRTQIGRPDEDSHR